MKDPDERCKCKVCLGPIYRDEPAGCLCPDCKRTAHLISRAHRLGAGHAGALPRALRAVHVVDPGGA